MLRGGGDYFLSENDGGKEKGEGGDLLSSPTSLSHPFSLGLGQGAEEEGFAHLNKMTK